MSNSNYDKYSKSIVKKFFWFPETIQGKTYWLKNVWVEKEEFIVHGTVDGCASDIWNTVYIRTISKLERALK